MKEKDLDYLKQIIKEELGIQTKVIQLSSDIYNSILLDIPNREKKKSTGCTIIEGSVKANVEGQTVLFSYVLRNFFSKETINTIGVDALTEGYSVFLDLKTILANINMVAISGQIYKKEAMYTIQHEVEHLYQEIRTKKRIPSNDMLYAKMRNDMEGADEERHKIARLVYACIQFEQEGFINGTYAWYMADDMAAPPGNFEHILDSPAGKLYEEAYIVFKEAKNNSNMQNILKEYGHNLTTVENALNKFLKRLGKVIVKVQNDKKKVWRK